MLNPTFFNNFPKNRKIWHNADNLHKKQFYSKRENQSKI